MSTADLPHLAAEYHDARDHHIREREASLAYVRALEVALRESQSQVARLQSDVMILQAIAS